MENILTLNQSIFGTKSTERKISRRALKASVQELYIPVESEEITYDEGYEVDGGGIINTIGLIGVGASIASSLILATDDYLSNWNLNWGTRMALKVIRFAGDIASTVSFMSNALKGQIANKVAEFILKFGGPVLDANIIAGMVKTAGIFSHFKSFWEK